MMMRYNLVFGEKHHLIFRPVTSCTKSCPSAQNFEVKLLMGTNDFCNLITLKSEHVVSRKSKDERCAL